jgi:hypothetical protein
MGLRLPCRVQWVTRPEDMHGLVARLTAAGGVLVARSAYDVATEDLDTLADADTGRLSIAEFQLDATELRRQLVQSVKQLANGDTLLIDLTGRRIKVQLLPVAGEHGVIIRRADGIHRLARATAGAGPRRRETSWLTHQLAQGGHA